MIYPTKQIESKESGLNALVNMYGPFFDLNNWATVIESGEDWLVILSLVVMECMLSVDNAVVLAAQTQSLPDKVEQEKSLFYGLFGAYIFRFLVIGVGVYLINFWWIKVFGAGYLFYLFLKHFFFDRNKSVDVPKGPQKENKLEKHLHISKFWQVVISIELMDIVFSIDSVLASLAVSNNPIIKRLSIIAISGRVKFSITLPFSLEGMIFYFCKDFLIVLQYCDYAALNKLYRKMLFF